MTWTRPLLLLVTLSLAAGCGDKKQKMIEAQKKRDAEKKKFEKEAEDKLKAAAPKIDRAKLDAFWDDSAYLRVTTGKPCPDGLWALFEGPPPGEGPELEANELRRGELATKMRGSTFVAVLPHGTGVTLHKYNAKKKTLTIEVDGVIECFDKLGLLSLAWGEPAKAFRPKPDDEEQLSPQAVWRARSLMFAVPFPNEAEAKAWAQKDGLTTEARIVFTLGKVELDKKVQKTARPTPDAPENTQEIDWGAGRLAHVELVGVRIATNFEKTLVVEQKGKK